MGALDGVYLDVALDELASKTFLTKVQVWFLCLGVQANTFRPEFNETPLSMY
jgi:hypothetical protein